MPDLIGGPPCPSPDPFRALNTKQAAARPSGEGSGGGHQARAQLSTLIVSPPGAICQCSTPPVSPGQVSSMPAATIADAMRPGAPQRGVGLDMRAADESMSAPILPLR